MKKPMVLHCLCFGSTEKSYGFTLVLLKVQRKRSGLNMVLLRVQETYYVTMVLFWVQRQSTGFTLFFYGKRKTMVLQSFCLGSKEQALVLHWFCLWSIEKTMGLQWFCLG